eukprot:365708-Chlamydomonas_euryale.AAC.9
MQPCAGLSFRVWDFCGTPHLVTLAAAAWTVPEGPCMPAAAQPAITKLAPGDAIDAGSGSAAADAADAACWPGGSHFPSSPIRSMLIVHVWRIMPWAAAGAPAAAGATTRRPCRCNRCSCCYPCSSFAAASYAAGFPDPAAFSDPAAGSSSGRL